MGHLLQLIRWPVRLHLVPAFSSAERKAVVTEDDIIAALDKPRALYSILQLVDPSSKSTEALQDQLMRMRSAGKVTFNIKTGKWSKV